MYKRKLKQYYKITRYTGTAEYTDDPTTFFGSSIEKIETLPIVQDFYYAGKYSRLSNQSQSLIIYTKEDVSLTVPLESCLNILPLLKEGDKLTIGLVQFGETLRHYIIKVNNTPIEPCYYEGFEHLTRKKTESRIIEDALNNKQSKDE